MCLGVVARLRRSSPDAPAWAWSWPADGAGAARVLGRRRHVRRRSAPRRRHRPRRPRRRCAHRSRARSRSPAPVPTNGLTVTIALGDTKVSLTHLGALRVRRGDDRLGGGRPRRRRPDGRRRARRPVRPSRRPRRPERDLRRPAHAPSASGRPPPSLGARGAARTTVCSRACAADVGRPAELRRQRQRRRVALPRRSTSRGRADRSAPPSFDRELRLHGGGIEIGSATVVAHA